MREDSVGNTKEQEKSRNKWQYERLGSWEELDAFVRSTDAHAGSWELATPSGRFYFSRCRKKQYFTMCRAKWRLAPMCDGWALYSSGVPHCHEETPEQLARRMNRSLPQKVQEFCAVELVSNPFIQPKFLWCAVQVAFKEEFKDKAFSDRVQKKKIDVFVRKYRRQHKDQTPSDERSRHCGLPQKVKDPCIAELQAHNLTN